MHRDSVICKFSDINNAHLLQNRLDGVRCVADKLVGFKPVSPSHHARNGPRGFGFLSVHQLEHYISKEVLLHLGVLSLVELNKSVHMGVLFRQNLFRGRE